MVTGPACVECGEASAPTTGKVIYPHRPGLHDRNYWLCPCGAYVGCHRGSQEPLGRPAGRATRDARKAAHGVFDRIWQRDAAWTGKAPQSARQEAYAWLSTQMGSATQVHMGNMTRDEARRATKICANYPFRSRRRALAAEPHPE